MRHKEKMEMIQSVIATDLLTAQGLTDRAIREIMTDANAIQNMFADVFAYLDTSDEDATDIAHIEYLATDNQKRIERLQEHQNKFRKLYQELMHEVATMGYYEP